MKLFTVAFDEMDDGQRTREAHHKMRTLRSQYVSRRQARDRSCEEKQEGTMKKKECHTGITGLFLMTPAVSVEYKAIAHAVRRQWLIRLNGLILSASPKGKVQNKLIDTEICIAVVLF